MSIKTSIISSISIFTPRPILIFSRTNKQSTSDIILSVIVPVFNQEAIIESVILSIVENVTSHYELIIIDDASEDQTLAILNRILSRIDFDKYSNLLNIRLFHNSVSQFETRCDDFGIRNSLGNFCLEIQADMIIKDYGFDIRMLRAAEKFPKLAAISGRGVERIQPIVQRYRLTLGTDIATSTSIYRYLTLRSKIYLKSKMNFFSEKRNKSKNFHTDLSKEYFQEQSVKDFKICGEAGRLGNKIELEFNPNFLEDRTIYFGETIMRGPMLINRKIYLQLGGFDTSQYFLGFDDHDFCFRAARKEFRVAYTPVHFSSPMELGSTRKKRSLLSEILIIANLVRISTKIKKKGLGGIEATNFDCFDPPAIDTF